jgi:hypothetical protein
MKSPDEILGALGYPPDKTTPEGKLVDSLVVEGQTLYASGQVAFDGEQLVSKGKVPSQVSLEAATQAARFVRPMCCGLFRNGWAL